VNLVLIAGHPVVHAAWIGELHLKASPASCTALRAGGRRGKRARSLAAGGPGLTQARRRPGGDSRQKGTDPGGAHSLAGFGDLMEALDKQLVGEPARRPHPATIAIAELRGVALESDDPADVRRRLVSLPTIGTRPQSGTLQVGEPQRIRMLRSAETRLGTGCLGRAFQALSRAACSGMRSRSSVGASAVRGDVPPIVPGRPGNEC
jgi:hypothetical protein